jgi:hypothetical protein
MNAGEAVGQDTALEKASQLAFHEARKSETGMGIELSEEGLEVLAQEFVEQRLRRITPAIAGAADLARSGGHAAWTWVGIVGLRAASGA